ncbi:hypothetical protein HZC07_01500, partial [Candidatus Micrarchaeota archaeon]|nr:hypothetical protein [Candidatus Micrarchaeota archaeon]
IEKLKQHELFGELKTAATAKLVAALNGSTHGLSVDELVRLHRSGPSYEPVYIAAGLAAVRTLSPAELREKGSYFFFGAVQRAAEEKVAFSFPQPRDSPATSGPVRSRRFN